MKHRRAVHEVRVGPEFAIREARDHDGDLVIRFYSRADAVEFHKRLEFMFADWSEDDGMGID